MRAYLVADTAVTETRSAEAVSAAVAAGQLVWVDLEARTAETETLLADAFSLHSLTVEDIWADRAAPKVEAFETYLYVIVYAGVVRPASRWNCGNWTLW